MTRSQEFLNIPARQRFPAFQELVWHAAIAAVARARTVAGLTAEDLCTRAAAVAEQRAKGAAGHPVGAGVSGVAGDGRAAQPAEGHSPAAIQTALHRKRSRKQVLASSYGCQPVLLLELRTCVCRPVALSAYMLISRTLINLAQPRRRGRLPRPTPQRQGGRRSSCSSCH